MMGKEKIEITPGEISEERTDMELALFWATHLDKPCGVEVGSGTVNLRESYLHEAQKALDKIVDPDARRFLELEIERHQEDCRQVK